MYVGRILWIRPVKATYWISLISQRCWYTPNMWKESYICEKRLIEDTYTRHTDTLSYFSVAEVRQIPIFVKRDLLKRHIHETCWHSFVFQRCCGTRQICQKRPIYIKKSPTHMSERDLLQNDDVLSSRPKFLPEACIHIKKDHIQIKKRPASCINYISFGHSAERRNVATVEEAGKSVHMCQKRPIYMSKETYIYISKEICTLYKYVVIHICTQVYIHTH